MKFVIVNILNVGIHQVIKMKDIIKIFLVVRHGTMKIDQKISFLYVVILKKNLKNKIGFWLCILQDMNMMEKVI
jgi:hypothetical protein